MNSDHHSIKDKIADLVTGLLPASEIQGLQTHLDSCEDCRGCMRALQEEETVLTDYFARMDERTAGRQHRVLQALENSRTNKRTTTLSIWRTIMTNRYSKLGAVAAAIVIAAIAFVFVDRSTTTAYAITDVATAFAQARTIHMQGWVYFPEHTMPDGQPIPPVKIDEWTDVRNNRWRDTAPGLGVDDNGVHVSVGETVCAGPYKMEVNHTRKSVRFSKVSEYQQRLSAYYMSKVVAGQLFGDVQHLANSAKVGQEKIDGVLCDIWQFGVDTPGGDWRQKVWLAADSGVLRRTQTLSRDHTGHWRLKRDYSVIEYNVPIPEGTFAMNPPEGYTVTNSLDTATPEELSRGGAGFEDSNCKLECKIRISFTLADGSVIMGWQSSDLRSTKPPAQLFEGLRFGGPLPKLPIEFYALKPTGDPNGPTYTGHHLAHTSKADQFVEWSLYVPDGAPPRTVEEFGYEVLHRFNLEPQPKFIPHVTAEYGIPIANAEDFDTWVLGAMAEFSDDATAPADVTYQKVIDLARQIRASAKP